MSKAAMFCMTFAFTVVMGAFVFLSVKHIDTASLVTFAIGLAAGVVPGIGAFAKTHQTKASVESMQKDVGVVMERTNGPLTAAMKTIEEQSSKVNNIENLLNEIKGTMGGGSHVLPGDDSH